MNWRGTWRLKTIGRKICWFRVWVGREGRVVVQAGSWLWLVCSSEKAMAPHSSTLAWKIPWAEKPGRLQSMVSLRVGHTTEQLHFHFSLSCIGEGNGKQPTPVFLPGDWQTPMKRSHACMHSHSTKCSRPMTLYSWFSVLGDFGVRGNDFSKYFLSSITHSWQLQYWASWNNPLFSSFFIVLSS